MIKNIKNEIEKLFSKNKTLQKGLEQNIKIKKVLESIPATLQKGITKITLKENTITIKTKTPSWRQEFLFFKKEIIKKIVKNYPNYNELKITIL